MTNNLNEFWEQIEEATESMLPVDQHRYFLEIGQNHGEYIEGMPDEIVDIRIELLRRMKKIVSLHSVFQN